MPDSKAVPETRLTVLQRKLPRQPPIEKIAEDLRLSSEQLIRITSAEGSSEARNLVSAELLSDILILICQYCNSRGWNVERVVRRAEKRGGGTDDKRSESLNI